jgi:eukaryotic-like serine/threonine-protein kinase
MTGPLVLPADIEIIALTSIPADLRARIQADGKDYAITRPRSRVPSKVIDAQAAELLREFEKPTTLVDAIRRFSKALQREPSQVLEDVYPFLESCLMSRLLVEPGRESEAILASFQKGDIVANCEVQDCIQVLADSELYRVRTGNSEAALKIERAGLGSYTTQTLANEAEVLKTLNGGIAPRMLFFGETEDGRAYLLTEWIAGESCGEAAAAIRTGSHEPLPAALLSLCVKVLDSYSTLHGLGVIHSDVHPNNLLVMENGDVRIIDHGLARIDKADCELPSIPRGGVGFFLEPEYAGAALSGTMRPLSTRAGEQYSVAALVYSLLTGHHYLDFSYGKEDMLRQIVEQSPVALEARGVAGAAALNGVLFRALSKDPVARFPDIIAMAAAFSEAVRHLPGHTGRNENTEGLGSAASSSPDGQVEHWLNSILDSLADSTVELPVAGPKFPTASLTYGSAGIAFGLFRIACAREDTRLFSLASQWLDRAAREIGQEAAFYNADLHVTPEIAGRVSPYHTPSGIFCAQALLAHSLGDLQTRSIAADRFLNSCNHACENPDITVGRSSVLLALSLLVDAVRWEETAEYPRLIEFGNKLLAGLWAQFDAMPPIGDRSLPTYLGMAHGWAGYLYATLRWMKSARATAPANLEARLQELADQALHTGKRIHWPRQTTEGSPALGGWCNGSAGFVFLWSMAHRLLQDPRWLELAEGAGWDAYHGREEGISLCCGLAGKAYSQLAIYKHTGDRHWVNHALAMGRHAVRKAEQTAKSGEPHIPLSLYKGNVGLAVLVAEVAYPECATMPFFEDEAWPVSRASG